MRTNLLMILVTIVVVLIQSSLVGWWWLLVWLWWLFNIQEVNRALWLGMSGGALLDILQADLIGVSSLILIVFIGGLWMLKMWVSQAVWIDLIWIMIMVAVATSINGQLDLVQVVLIPLLGLMLINLIGRFERRSIRLSRR